MHSLLKIRIELTAARGQVLCPIAVMVPATARGGGGGGGVERGRGAVVAPGNHPRHFPLLSVQKSLRLQVVLATTAAAGGGGHRFPWQHTFPYMATTHAEKQSFKNAEQVSHQPHVTKTVLQVTL